MCKEKNKKYGNKDILALVKWEVNLAGLKNGEQKNELWVGLNELILLIESDFSEEVVCEDCIDEKDDNLVKGLLYRPHEKWS